MSTSRELSVLAVGLGRIFQNAHFPILKRLPEVMSIVGVELSAERRRFWETRDPEMTVLGHLNEALESGKYDCAVVTTYPRGRARLTRQLHNSGIGTILCEKPLDAEPRGVEEIRSLVAEEGLVLVPCHSWSFSQLAAVVEEEVRKSLQLPASLHLRVERTCPALGADEANPQWRTDLRLAGGGVLCDHGYHCLYLARRWLREKSFTPIEVRSEADDSGIDWTTHAVFLGSRGNRLQMDLTWKASVRSVCYCFTSRGRTLTANDEHVLLEVPGQKPCEVFSGESLSRDGIHLAWYEKIYQVFLSALHGDTSNASLLWEEALAVSQTLIEAYKMMQPIAHCASRTTTVEGV